MTVPIEMQVREVLRSEHIGCDCDRPGSCPRLKDATGRMMKVFSEANRAAVEEATVELQKDRAALQRALAAAEVKVDPVKKAKREAAFDGMLKQIDELKRGELPTPAPSSEPDSDLAALQDQVATLRRTLGILSVGGDLHGNWCRTCYQPVGQGHRADCILDQVFTATGGWPS